MKRQHVRVGPLEFYDPALLCGALYGALYFDASGFLRLGLLAAFLHEWGHILAYIAFAHRFPRIAVTITGFCMHTRGERFTARQTFLLAAAGPGANALLAAVWAVKMSHCATVRGAAFLAANVITAAFNLLPVPPLDGAQMLKSITDALKKSAGNRADRFWRRCGRKQK